MSLFDQGIAQQSFVPGPLHRMNVSHPWWLVPLCGCLVCKGSNWWSRKVTLSKRAWATNFAAEAKWASIRFEITWPGNFETDWSPFSFDGESSLQLWQLCTHIRSTCTLCFRWSRFFRLSRCPSYFWAYIKYPRSVCECTRIYKHAHTHHPNNRKHREIYKTEPLFFFIFFWFDFSTGNSSLEPLIEGLCAQIHVNLRWRVFGRNRTGDLTDY